MATYAKEHPFRTTIGIVALAVLLALGFYVATANASGDATTAGDDRGGMSFVSDDPPGDDRGGSSQASDDSAWDDKGGSSQASDDPPGDDRGGSSQANDDPPGDDKGGDR